MAIIIIFGLDMPWHTDLLTYSRGNGRMPS